MSIIFEETKPPRELFLASLETLANDKQKVWNKNYMKQEIQK